MRLGICTHSEEELAIALAAEPDYVALGPDLRDQAQGHEMGAAGPRAHHATGRQRIGALPLVAIGGITPERADGVLAAGADSVAVITDFFTHPDPGGARAPVAGLGGAHPA